MYQPHDDSAVKTEIQKIASTERQLGEAFVAFLKRRAEEPAREEEAFRISVREMLFKIMEGRDD